MIEIKKMLKITNRIKHSKRKIKKNEDPVKKGRTNLK